MSKIVTRGPLSVLLAGLALLAGASAALAASQGTTKLYACVTGQYGTLNLTTKSAHCPSGQQKISWNVKGLRGPKGERGAQGERGASGSPGAAGQAGATGPSGAAGANGQAGATGPTGPIGATGPTGPAGLGSTMLLSSGPATLTTLPGGLPGESGFLPLSGALLAENDGPAAVAGTATEAATQVVPAAFTANSIYGQAVTDVALSLVGTTVSLEAVLYQGSGGGTPTATGVSCPANPPLTGIVTSGMTMTFACTGLAHSFLAGDTGYFELRASATGIAMFNTIPVHAALSLGS